jgi:Fe-S cluster assembly iron-binding protein IscA
LFEVTPAAVASVKRMTKEAHLNGPVALIVGVKADGFHTLDLTEEGLDPKTSLQFESNGITVRILRTDADALRGWSLDWGKDGDREGFVFKNSAGR